MKNSLVHDGGNMHAGEQTPDKNIACEKTGLGEKKALHQAVKRLPCRGCLVSCSYYMECNGRPWRMAI